MELSSQDQPGDIPIPMNTTTTYGHHHGHGHMHHHLHHVSQNPNIIPSHSPSQPQPQPSNGGTSIPMHISLSTQTLEEDHNQDHDHDVPYNNNNSKKSSMVVVKYKECLKNHAAAMGGNATDGCGEFMPSGGEGSIEALTCSACNCHRNFHRKEIQGSDNSSSPHLHHYNRNSRSKVNILGHHQYYPKNVLAPAPESLGYPTPTGTLIASRAMPQHHHHHMIMSYHSMGSSDHDQSDEDHGHGHHHQVLKKRFRTKFTQEQKEKMLNFAEKVGWKIQKQEDSVVQQFCQEIGVKRRVLKVWMHNNKHNLAKKNNNNNNLHDLQPPSTTTNTTTTSS